MLEIIVAVLLVILPLIIYKYSTRNFDYWKKKNVHHLPPVPLFGNYSDFILLKGNLGMLSDKFYKAFPDRPYVGALLGKHPVLILRDPEIIKLVMSKDFYYFNSRGLGAHMENEPLNTNLFMTDGDTWRVLRQNLTPLFTSAKMKNMLHLMSDCGKQFEQYVKSLYEKSDEHEMRDVMNRFSMDVIGSCAFGLHMNSMSEQDTEFRKVGLRLFRPTLIKSFKSFVRIITPWVYNVLGLSMIDPDINKFFVDLSKTVIAMREGRPPERHDFIDLLAELKQKGHIDGDSIESMKVDGEKTTVSLKLDKYLIAAQSFIFFGAGFETSSTTTSYVLRELALNMEIQKKVQLEIDTLLKKHDGHITYELIKEATYLEKVINETLRLYPVLMVITRQCTSPYKFPDGLVIEEGVRVHIPVYSLHHDAKYYPDPEVFNPERFSPEAMHGRPHYTFMPFGEGQRICIGMRFGRMQVAVGLISLLKNFTVAPCARTETTFTVEPKSMITSPKNGVWLKLSLRNK